jgi:hypothetical protein
MYIVLNHIWNRTKVDKKRRMLIVDEAWQLMRYEDSANFLFSLAKRARKYNLGITTITQDVEDFMASRMGRAIVANASMQILLKQSPTAVDVLSDVFKLTSEEKKRLSQFPVGQGLFFAGQNHVHIQVIASPTENELIVTTPKPQQQPLQAAPMTPMSPMTPPPAPSAAPAPIPTSSLAPAPMPAPEPQAPAPLAPPASSDSPPSSSLGMESPVTPPPSNGTELWHNPHTT